MKKKDEQIQFEQDLVSDVKNDFAKRQAERKNYERQWQLNMNFVMGNQYCVLNDFNELENYGKQYFWQEREIYNHIATIIENRIAKLCKIRPTLNVAPSSGSEKDIGTAKISRKILNTLEHNLRLSEKIAQATNWSEICGTSFYKIVWNSEIGSIVGLDYDGKSIRDGEVDISVCSPFEIYPDNNMADGIDSLESIIHAKPYKVSQIERIWNVSVEPEDIDVLTLNNQSLAGGLGYTASVSKVISEKAKDSAIVIERYEAPSNKYPNGRVVIVAGNKLLGIQELPYKNKTDGERGFPFVRQCSIAQVGNFWGNSIIERLIPIQRSYNAIKNRKHEFLNRIALGILTVEDGSVDVDNLEDEGLSPGKVLVYRQGSTPPTIMQTNQMPSAFEKEEENLLSEFVQVSGINDANLTSTISSANISGVALEIMVEQENERLSATADQVKYAVVEIGKQILRLYKQFASQKRLGKIEDNNGHIELFYWNSSDISSDDVVLDTTNEIGETLVQKRNMIFELLKAGLLQDENGKLDSAMKKKTLEMIGFGTWQDVNDLTELHNKRAGKENLDFLKGRIDDVLEIDDHKVHINSHTAFLLSQDILNSENGKQIAQNIMEHIEKHKKFLSGGKANE